MLSSAEAYAFQQSRLTALVEGRVAQLWSQVRATTVMASWLSLAPQVLHLIVAAQIAAARPADLYVDAALAEQGIDTDRSGTLRPASFAGTASDGRSLVSLLELPLTGEGGVLDLIGQGADPAGALRSGGFRLALMAAATVQDAGRSAAGAAITARPHVGGYIRTLQPPSCSRCVILAGKFYRWNAGFRRHLHCDCQHVPVNEADAADLVTDPQAYVRSLSAAQQEQLLGKASAQAVRDGADLNQVVNARSGIGVNGLTTSVGTTRRGLAGQRLQGGRRLTAEGIYAISSDRTEALRLLKQHGYLL